MSNLPIKAGTQGTYLTSPYQVTVNYSDPNAPPPKTVPGSDWFGPLNPLRPIAPVGVQGRTWDYPSGYNLNTVARSYVSTSFETLRAMADSYDLLRLVIETRKDQLKRLTWEVRPKNRFSKKNVDDQVKKARDFLEKPDGFHTFSEWLGMVLEDLFVIDAPTLYRQRTRGGRLIAVHPIDGQRIKPVIDNFGRTPLPYKQGKKTIYPVAYQHILKGYPAIDYSVRDIIYKPRNVRNFTPYGFSPVESIITTVNIALRRQAYTLSYFSEGSIPDSLIGVPESWSPQQIEAYQGYWDTYFEGDGAHRRKAKFVPGGVAKTFIQTKEPDLKGEFDDWLSRIVCFAFSVSPQALIKSLNRASSDTQKAMAEEEGLVPIMQWVKELIDIILKELDVPDVEFVFSGENAIDESAQAVILDGQVKLGIKSINEARIQNGDDPFPDPACDRSMVYTAMGFMPVDANTDEGVKARMKITGSAPQTQPGASAPKGPGPGQSSDTSPKVQTGAAATARKLLDEDLTIEEVA